ncbi:MAG: hypothetical protein OEX81_02345 [Candidatus Pacebacteria bacterium]|nr:hypothetical protein [Candidatus Paceibacterota bacterium]
MKNKGQFYKNCGVGFVIIFIVLFGTLFIRNARGLVGYNNPIAFIAPLLFIPLLVSVFHDSRYNCASPPEKNKSSKVKPVYKKDTCVVVVGIMLTITLIVSMIVLYYGW